jgi:hypothetical protein
MKRHVLKLAILGAILIPAFAVTPAQAQATRTWVSGVGDDANPCSRTAPCKTFAGAISKTAPNGKINCLDPGGFGAVTITKAIEIDCLQFPGGILNSLTTGVIVNTPTGNNVILRGIEIHGAGNGIRGVNMISATNLTIDKCFITAQAGEGIVVNSNVAGVSNLVVLDTVITQTTNGIAMTGTGGHTAIGHIRNSTIHKVSQSGILLNASSFATVSHSMLTGNTNGGFVNASGSQLNVVDSVITYNSVNGLAAGVSGAQVRIQGNYITNNTTSTSFVAGATLSSAGDNKIDPLGSVPNASIGTQ